MNLLDDIPEGHRVGLDTMIWIYEVVAHAVFGPLVRPFFQDRLGSGRNQAGSSLLTLGELLVQPIAVGRTDLADRYRHFLSSSDFFAVWDVTRAVVELAATLRAKYQVKMMDGLHLASAMVNAAELFLSNEEKFRRITEIKVLVLADYVLPGSP